MQLTIPHVIRGRLYRSDSTADAILVGTPAWYDWLEQHTAFLFGDLGGGFLARKSRTDSNELEWEASRTRLGKLYRVPVGKSVALTLSRLQDVARSLVTVDAPAEPIGASGAQPAAPPLPAFKTAVPVGSLSSLMRSKHYRPRTTSDVIPRAHLLERLNAGLSSKVTLVCAPAGFGKTTLLAEWVKTIKQHTAWLSLDADDNELPVFVRSLTAALQTVFPDAFGVTASLLEALQSLPADRTAILLNNDLADLPEDIVLVLDDYHLIRNSDVHTLLELLIRYLPPQVHLVVVARSHPPLPLVKWQAQGHLNELQSADLRFTLAETEVFLMRVLGSVATHETVLALDERTEGWIAVLRLGALSLRSASDRLAFMERLRHYPDRSINQYLLEEILAQQAPAVQALLIRISVLEQCCAQLCVAIMGDETLREQVQASLEMLERTNVFLVPLDEHHEWYRFHPLFKQLLVQRLQTYSSQEEITTLHRRASAWYAAQGLIEKAIEHALATGEATEAARLVEGQFLWAYEQERWVQMERWLGLVPEDQIQGSSVLLLTRAWIAQMRGQVENLPSMLTAAEQLLRRGDSGASDANDRPSRILHALIALGWSHYQWFTGQTEASLKSAQCALRWLPAGEKYIESHALSSLARPNQVTGQEEVALNALNTALREPSAPLNTTAHLLFAQANVYLAAGKLHQVEHTARHLLQLAQDADLPVSQQWAHRLVGCVYYEWNDLYTAAYHFSVVIANRHRADFLAVQDAICGLALTYQAQGLDPHARAIAHDLLEWVQEQHNLRELMTAYAFQGRLALLQEDVESAEPWLEMAGEQEVRGPMLFFEDPPVTRARLLLAKGDQASVAQGQTLLTQLLQHVEAMHSTGKTINVLALQAWAYDLQGCEAEALDVLERALVLGRPAGFVRTFADLPKLSPLLQELRKRRKTCQQVDSKLDAYLQHILVAMNPLSAQVGSTEEAQRQEVLEPLTARELQILHLLDKDLSNKEIAHELVVTPGTVKAHTNNVFRKLSVNNRHAAVTLSKALGLLPGVN